MRERLQLDGTGLPLAVGHGERDAVLHEPDAAHPEGGAGAEATRGDLQVLGIVVAIAHDDAGDPAEQVGQVGADALALDGLGPDGVEGERQSEAGGFGPGGGDGDRLEASCGPGLHLLLRLRRTRGRPRGEHGEHDRRRSRKRGRGSVAQRRCALPGHGRLPAATPHGRISVCSRDSARAASSTRRSTSSRASVGRPSRLRTQICILRAAQASVSGTMSIAIDCA